MPTIRTLMMLTFSVLGLGLTAVQTAGPPFCHGLECPVYTVVNRTGNVEIRTYEPAYWVSTNYSGADNDAYRTATETCFHRLFDYISGQNANHQSINMTAPVTVRIYPGAGPNCNTTFTVSFFVPFAYQGKAPAPSSNLVFLDLVPAATVATLSYGGFSEDWQTEVLPRFSDLIQFLDSHQVKYDATRLETAVYDGPYTIINRHNEVWLPLL
eukprot:TRINITY_DN643_c0_g1_i1.p3 TRINITY_DN643_c0_g1~~TRINITY_DN643_c0_g1_i1.p3  ORF type:complete len:212 (+),score=45.88 TRINITY_DN643_c0_g1_i1:68-703(+)